MDLIKKNFKRGIAAGFAIPIVIKIFGIILSVIGE